MDTDLGSRIKRMVDDAIEAHQEDGRRAHLGPSALGNQCDKAVWYGFRWHSLRRFEAKKLRVFERGQNEEAVIVRRLRLAGIVVGRRGLPRRAVRIFRLRRSLQGIGGWNRRGAGRRGARAARDKNDK